MLMYVNVLKCCTVRRRKKLLAKILHTLVQNSKWSRRDEPPDTRQKQSRLCGDINTSTIYICLVQLGLVTSYKKDLRSSSVGMRHVSFRPNHLYRFRPIQSYTESRIRTGNTTRAATDSTFHPPPSASPARRAASDLARSTPSAPSTSTESSHPSGCHHH